MNQYLFFWTYENLFSNFYPTNFTYDNKPVCCSEQAFMMAKAKRFNDTKIYNELCELTKHREDYSPNLFAGKAKSLGRQVQNYDEKIWKNERYDIMVDVLKKKFENPKHKDVLLSTKDLILVEASPYDEIWGIGLKESNPDAKNPRKWKGQNLLGKALMEVRDFYQKEQ